MYPLKNGQWTNDPKLDRCKQVDLRSLAWPASEVLTADQYSEPRSYTWLLTINLDQGEEGACVGCGWADELAARPGVVSGVTFPWAREAIYFPAQRADQWEGGAYPGACVDLDTHALCRAKGWVGPDRLEVGDEVLAFNLETQATEWSRVLHVNRYVDQPYSIVRCGTLEQAVTDNHRWVVRPSDSEMPHTLVRTDELTTKFVVPLCAPRSDLPSKPEYEDDFVELVAWAVTEGYFRPASRRTGDSHRQAGVHGRRQVGPWELSGDLARRVRDVAPGGEPRIEWVASLTPRQLRLFIAASCWADGHRKAGKPGYKDAQVFVQKPGGVLDAFLAACVLAGIPVSRQGAHPDSGCETWALRTDRQVYTQRMTSERRYGDVWCPTTEVGTFVARRHASVWITGNSPFYEGTSVLAGAQVVKAAGYIHEYRWALTIEDLVTAVGYHGPAVIGVDWYEGMFATDADGFIHPTGRLMGGHCVCIVGVKAVRGADGKLDPLRSYFLIHNSWGAAWGIEDHDVGGRCKLTVAEMLVLWPGGDFVIPIGRVKAVAA